jgi:ribosome biogenesis GTPase
MKIDGEITSTNPVAVGDQIEMEVEDAAQKTGVITGVCARDNYIIRTSPHSRFRNHIVAANLDQAVLVATLKQPRTSPGFIDRYLVTAAAYHIPAVLVFNKQDLYREKEMAVFRQWSAVYAGIGYPVLLTSALQGYGMADLEAALAGKTSLFTGHSGVGKSTLINDLVPGLDLRTDFVSDSSGKGMHTTTFAQMFELPFTGRIIDTPGIRELGIVDMDRAELSHYFPEMVPLLADCRFNNCLHLNEPGCAVRTAAEEGRIAMARYESYLSILATLNAPEW